MLNRKDLLLVRLLKAYKLLLGGLLLLIWIAAITYFVDWERNELRRNTLAAAAMLATQSSAALMFGDIQALQENLESLKELEGFRWAAVIPVTAEAGFTSVRQGASPADVGSVLKSMGATTYRMSFNELLVRAPISHRGLVRGQLLISVDLEEELEGFLQISAITLVLLAVVFQIGQALFRRIAESIVAPLGELTTVASAVAAKVMHDAPLEALPMPVGGFSDEIGQLANAFSLMLDTLRRRDVKMREQSAQLERLVDDLRALSARMRAVREEERTRISHEIHDELGQRLTALKYEVARLNVGELAKTVLQQIDELIRTVRVISWELRPSVLDSLGLVAAIEWQAQDFARRMRIRCSVDLPEDEPHIAAEMATDLFRVFQELLTNVSRHAQATRVDVLLEVTEQAIFLEVKDDGRGVRTADESRPSLGLLGMRERLERWGGRIDISPAMQKPIPTGTRVVIEIPLGFGGALPDLEQMQ